MRFFSGCTFTGKLLLENLIKAIVQSELQFRSNRKPKCLSTGTKFSMFACIVCCISSVHVSDQHQNKYKYSCTMYSYRYGCIHSIVEKGTSNLYSNFLSSWAMSRAAASPKSSTKFSTRYSSTASQNSVY